jgi:Fe-Mn family superoxide dismutase
MTTRAPPAPPVGPYHLPPLGFAYGDLAPVIDEVTMRLHHLHHHRAYVDGVNAALAQHRQWLGLTIEALMNRLPEVPEDIRPQVRVQGGGHANHQFFWKILTPGARDGPEGGLASAIERDFGSFDAFRSQFEAAGLAHVGSGWVCLVVRPQRDFRLEILTLANQDSLLVLEEPAPGLLICDLWEHSYYLHYQNRRKDWLQAWWRVVNWPYVGERWAGVLAGHTQL